MLTRQVRRRFVRNRLGQIGVVICLVVVAVVITAPWIGRYDPAALGAGDPLAAPSWTHWFGTDELGRDVFARVAYAARIALYVAVASTAFAALVGIPLGLASGYYGGWIDSIMMRVTDAWLAFPIMVLALGMTAAIGPGLNNATFAIGFVSIPNFVRLARGQTIAAKERPYVEAARVAGQHDAAILHRHVLPNVLSVMIVLASLTAGNAILVETALSFLGVGVMPPTPSWGAMLSSAQPYLALAPWLAVAPGVAIFLLVLGFNLVGDGVRDALDPRTQP